MAEAKRTPPGANAAENPNQWTVIGDYAKTVITLASALLGFTVTFSQDILGKTTSTSQSCFLVGAWFALLLAIISGVAALAFVINVLRHGTHERPCIFCCNVAFISLVISGILFVCIGWGRINSQEKWSAGQAIEDTLKRMPSIANRKGSDWDISSLSWQSKSGTYLLVTRNQQSGEIWNVIVDPKQQKVVRARRKVGR